MARQRGPRPGDEWEAPDGRRIYVEEVCGDSVNGTSNLSSFTTSGRPAGPVGLSVWTGSTSDFEHYTLVGPRWTVRFDAPVEGSHPTNDPVFDALGAVGTIEHRSMPPTGTVVSYAHASYEMTLVGSDEDEVRQRVIDALAPFEALPPGSVTVTRAL